MHVSPVAMLAFAAAAVIVVAVVFIALRRRRTGRLHERFGPEYERAVREAGSVTAAEATLEARQRRVERLHIHPLEPDDTARFSRAWRDVQTRFVDNPKDAITSADRLIGEVMRARGYPVGEFDQRVADMSVDHADVVMHYRAARDIATDHARGRATTEDLRQAMVHYRALFADLLETNTPRANQDTHELTAERGRS